MTPCLHLHIDVLPIVKHDMDVQDDLALELVAPGNGRIVDPEHVDRGRWSEHGGQKAAEDVAITFCGEQELEDDIELRIQGNASHGRVVD